MIYVFFTPSQAAQPRQATLHERIFHMDIVGVSCVLASFTCFILAMHSAGSTKGWTSRPVTGYLLGFVLFLVLFAVVEWRMGSQAMIQFHLLRKLPFVANLIFSFFLAGVYFPLLFSLPIQFQSLYNASASASGTRLIPLVLGISVFTMVSNALVSRFRYYTPWLVLGSVFMTLGGSLIFTLDSHASAASWIGYELITAVGVGLAFQIPLMANQASVARADIPTAISTTLFVENIGQALFVAAGEAAFIQKLVASLAASATHIDPQRVVAAGATRFRDVFGDADVQQILRSYGEALRLNHALSMGCGVLATVVSFVIATPAVTNSIKARINRQHVR